MFNINFDSVFLYDSLVELFLIIPFLKNAVYDIIVGALDMSLYGRRGKSGGRGGRGGKR